MAAQKKEWALTREALDRLLEFLDSDPDRAASAYEQVRQRLMKLFRWRGCLSFEEYTDITIDRAARLIAEGTVKTSNRYALFHGVALNVIREHWRKSEREAHALDGPEQIGVSAPDAERLRELLDEEAARETRIQCLRQCLQRLSAESLTLIKKYYAEGEVLDKNQRKHLAGTLKISVNALRVRAFRIRGEVEQCVTVCLNQKEQG